MVGFTAHRNRARRWVRNLRDRSKRKVKEAARIVLAAERAEFAGRLTNPRTRKRSGGGKRLGTFTGRGKRNLRVRLFKGVARGRKPRIVPGRNAATGSWGAFIGPSGEIAGSGSRWQSGRAFYLRFHDKGIGGMPRRQIIRPAVEKTRARVQRKLRGIGRIRWR